MELRLESVGDQFKSSRPRNAVEERLATREAAVPSIFDAHLVVDTYGPH
jgi:hypothetical protein